MREATGQAARLAGGRLHRLAQVVLALVVLLLAGFAVLAWRLDQGPLPVPWLAHRLERAARERGLDLAVGEVTLAWSGFSRGFGQPLRLAVADLRLSGAPGAPPPVVLARATAEFATGSLLAGRLVPFGVTLDGLRATLTREPAGEIVLGTQPAPGPPIAGMVRGAQSQGKPASASAPRLDWRQLRHLHLHDLRVALYDAQIGLSWQVSRADADFDRAANGLVAGRADVAIAAGAQHATLTLTARQRGDGTGSEIEGQLTPLDPASLAGLASAFGPLGMLDAPVSLSASADLDTGFQLRHAHVQAQVGAGTVHAGTGSAPLLSATLAADATPTTVDLTQRLETAARPDGPRTVITGTMRATRAGADWRAAVTGDVDQVSFADLPALWPAGTGGPGSRPWISGNITSGELSGGHLAMTLDIPADLSDAHLVSIDGSIDGHDLTVHWLRPVPPIEHADGRLTITDPDVIDIAVSTARQARGAQAGGAADGIAFSHGLVHLTGIAGPDQFADITTDLAGSLPDLIAVLNHPRVKLLSKRPIPMRDPAGQFTAHLIIAHLPLRDDVAMDDLSISTKGHFTGVHLGGIAAGRDLDRGALDLSADNNGLQVGGHADLAGIPAQLRVSMDFRAGPPSQIEQQVNVAGSIDARQLAALGLDTRGIAGGSVEVSAEMRSRRDGRTEIEAKADLTPTTISLSRLNYSKAAGQQVTGSLRVSLDHDRLVSIDRVLVQGPGIDIEGAADFAGGRPQILRLTRIVIAAPGDPRATDARATIRLPSREGDAYAVDLSGASLDASGVLTRRSPALKPAKGQPAEAAGPAWTLDARLGRVLLGRSRQVDSVEAHVENDGRVVRAARLSGIARSTSPAGQVQRPAPFRLSIVPERGGRRLDASAPDAGGLLRVLDVADNISGGRMTVAARFDDALPGRPLVGTAELHEFRVLDAPVIGRVLQAATLYGLIEVLRGPGLGFTTMVAPFRFQDSVLYLDEARAFSASLGFTAKGEANLGRRTLDMSGTIVPAYALNTLPGRIPLLGRLFSPERGGGLFAATYRVRGSFDDPKVGINPLATLTPGFLRGLFGIFDGGGKGGRR